MKRILLVGIFCLSLTGCHMEADQYSGQEIFYGETLITNETDRENLERNNSFIYNPNKDDYYDCEDYTDYEEEEFDH